MTNYQQEMTNERQYIIFPMNEVISTGVELIFPATEVVFPRKK